jgi:hypothetical protein
MRMQYATFVKLVSSKIVGGGGDVKEPVFKCD